MGEQWWSTHKVDRGRTRHCSRFLGGYNVQGGGKMTSWPRSTIYGGERCVGAWGGQLSEMHGAYSVGLWVREASGRVQGWYVLYGPF